MNREALRAVHVTLFGEYLPNVAAAGNNTDHSQYWFEFYTVEHSEVEMRRRVTQNGFEIVDTEYAEGGELATYYADRQTKY